MARYKHHDYAQSKLIPVHFDRQVLPGTFEHTRSYVIEHECDLSWFEERFHNDETGAPAYDPPVLLKIILFAYSRGITSSRAIARACEENVLFTALSADTRPQLVAERIERAVRAVGDPARIIAGTDCGFGTLAGDCFTAEDVVWAKLESLVEGARRASRVFGEAA